MLHSVIAIAMPTQLTKPKSAGDMRTLTIHWRMPAKADAVALRNPPSPFPAQLAQHVSLELPQPLIVFVWVSMCVCV